MSSVQVIRSLAKDAQTIGRQKPPVQKRIKKWRPKGLKCRKRYAPAEDSGSESEKLGFGDDEDKGFVSQKSNSLSDSSLPSAGSTALLSDDDSDSQSNLPGGDNEFVGSDPL